MLALNSTSSAQPPDTLTTLEQGYMDLTYTHSLQSNSLSLICVSPVLSLAFTGRILWFYCVSVLNPSLHPDPPNLVDGVAKSFSFPLTLT